LLLGSACSIQFSKTLSGDFKSRFIIFSEATLNIILQGKKIVKYFFQQFLFFRLQIVAFEILIPSSSRIAFAFLELLFPETFKTSEMSLSVFDSIGLIKSKLSVNALWLQEGLSQKNFLQCRITRVGWPLIGRSANFLLYREWTRLDFCLQWGHSASFCTDSSSKTSSSRSNQCAR